MEALATTRPAERSFAAIALSLNDVSVERASKLIVEGTTFSVASGGAVVLKGANGSGKTTLLRAIAGLSPIAAGVIEFSVNGAKVSAASERRDTAVLCGHADAVKQQLTVGENIAFWTRLYRTPHSSAERALGAFNLVALAPQRAANLSAGQRRRLALSRLVVSGKPVWLLDEPTSSVDEASTKRLISLIEEHRARGGVAIIATHEKIDIGAAQRFTLNPGPTI